MRAKPRGLRDGLGRRGIAAVEFAIIVPFMLILFIGAIEIATMYRTSLKLNSVVYNVAQMISLSGGVSVAPAAVGSGVTSLNEICKGATLGLAPFPAGGMTLNIASITQENGTNYDSWEQDSTVRANGTCSAGPGAGAIIGSQTYLDVTSGVSTALLKVPCDNVIIVQASLKYPGIMGVILQARPTLTQTAYVRWGYGSLTTELLCADCTTIQMPSQICKS